MNTVKKRGARINIANERILRDERIRRIILANEDKIRTFERLRGCRCYASFNLYVNNKYDVWKDYHKSGESQYISAGQLIQYLEHLGYKLDYIITKVEDNEVI